MSGLLLSPEERLRFVEYCRREAASLSVMAEQINKLSGMELMHKNYRARSMAYQIVADDLAKVEDGRL